MGEGCATEGKGKSGGGEGGEAKAGRRGVERINLSHKEIKGKRAKTEKGIIC